MPKTRCPNCHHKGDTGPMFGPVGSVGPDISVKPGTAVGSSKLLMHCRNCGTTFLKGKFRRGKPVANHVWEEAVNVVERDLPDHMMVYQDKR